MITLHQPFLKLLSFVEARFVNLLVFLQSSRVMSLKCCFSPQDAEADLTQVFLDENVPTTDLKQPRNFCF